MVKKCFCCKSRYFGYYNDFSFTMLFSVFFVICWGIGIVWYHFETKQQAEDYFSYLMLCGSESKIVCVDIRKLKFADDYGLKIIMLSKKYSELGYKVSNNERFIFFEKE